MPRSVLEAGMARSRESTDNPFEGIENVDDLPFGTPDDEIAARIDAHRLRDAKIAAHAGARHPDPGRRPGCTRSRATSAASSWAWSTTRWRRREGPGAGPNGWEGDLFAGLPASALAAAPS